MNRKTGRRVPIALSVSLAAARARDPAPGRLGGEVPVPPSCNITGSAALIDTGQGAHSRSVEDMEVNR